MFVWLRKFRNYLLLRLDRIVLYSRCFGVGTGEAGCAVADVITNNQRQSKCVVQASIVTFETFSQDLVVLDGQT